MSEEIMNRESNTSLRSVPYPYKAMLAICSDLDETPDKHIYLETMKYLNTTDETSMGKGVGLEVGNTIYFDMPPDQFSYWNTDESGREMVRSLIHSGHIDCIHSYGDLASTRAHAERALNELKKYGSKLEVWIDHAITPINFGSEIMYGQGDFKDSEAYHADLTCDYGIKYVWRGWVTSVIGQNVPRNMKGVWTPRHPLASALTVLKGIVKGFLGKLGNTKYAMHGPNQVLREIQLRSGQEVWEFLRCNPSWGGVSNSETADGIAEVLVDSILYQLEKKEGICVLYTHLGKFKNYEEPFGPGTREAFRRLAQYSKDKRIMVTTTRRLLGYCQAVRNIMFQTSLDGDWLNINMTYKGDLEDLNGLTLYVIDPNKTRLMINKKEVTGLQHNSPDHTGRRSVSVPWLPLEFPHIQLCAGE